MNITKPTALDAWKSALHHIMNKGSDFQDHDGRTCREVLNLSVTIQHPDVGIEDPIDTIRKINKWIYPSKDELVNIIFNQYDLPVYDYTYGSRIFGYQEVFDQINDYIIPLLKQHPNSRRATVITIDPIKDLKLSNRNVPGLVSLHCKVDDGKLLLTAVIRSNDYFIGWPANIHQLAALQQYLAEALELRVGELMTYSISAHVFKEYEEDIQQVLDE
ncbi:hypothetical protein GF367_00380 [Candidatus Woesearchaeota archaeon]|nr:hypothetical protein [Candidatus Woesearchaeota archaeon]